MMPATDGIRAARGVKRSQEPEPQGRATSEEEQAYPARLVLAQGRVSWQPPPLVAAKHTVQEETTWGTLHLQEEVHGGPERGPLGHQER